MARAYLATILLLAGGLSACETGGTQAGQLPGEAAIGLTRGETLPAFTPEPNAERNYAAGEAAFERERYILAQRFYIYTRRNYPYSRFAILADLRIADCQYEREQYLESIDSYQTFARLHPTHPRVGYALFKMGVARSKQIPEDFFFMPPAHEKDQKVVEETAETFATYLRRFPDGENAEEAKERLSKVRERLVAHERYVADFYKKREKYRGYVGRLERIRTKFGEAGLDPDLLVEMVQAYVALHDGSKAQQRLDELEQKFPEAEEQKKKAREALASFEPAPLDEDLTTVGEDGVPEALRR